MRVRVDRGAEALLLELSGAAVARRAEVAEGVALAYDAAGRIVGVEVRGVDTAALHEFAVDLTGVADRPAVAAFAASTATSSSASASSAASAASWERPAGSQTTPVPATPAFYAGPVSWDPEAEAAVAQISFFRRGPTRLAAIALARKRGLDRVTPALLAETRGVR